MPELQNPDRGLQAAALLDMGQALLACGAEVHRVEDTLTRLAAACGARESSVFVITSNISLTMRFEENEYITQIRRIPTGGSNNFAKLEQLNGVSRAFCGGGMEVKALSSQIRQIMDAPANSRYNLIGSVLGSGAFALFFGGNFADALLAGCVGLLLVKLLDWLEPLCMNRVILNLVSSFLMGLLVLILGSPLPFIHPDMVMIGDIMLLIPGIAMTNAVRDILLGDTISGSMRFMETLLWAGALAFGVMGAIWVTGGLL